MSMRDVLRDHLEHGRLIQVLPFMPGAAQARLVYGTPDVLRQLDPATADDELHSSAGQLRGWLDNFTRGRRVVVGPRTSKTADMKRLDPQADEVWEIRKRDSPSARVFGHFLESDVFIALGARTVSDLFAERWLTKMHVEIWPIWRQEIRNCKVQWRQLFPTYKPHSGETLSDYLTAAIDERSL